MSVTVRDSEIMGPEYQGRAVKIQEWFGTKGKIGQFYWQAQELITTQRG